MIRQTVEVLLRLLGARRSIRGGQKVRPRWNRLNPDTFLKERFILRSDRVQECLVGRQLTRMIDLVIIEISTKKFPKLWHSTGLKNGNDNIVDINWKTIDQIKPFQSRADDCRCRSDGLAWNGFNLEIRQIE